MKIHSRVSFVLVVAWLTPALAWAAEKLPAADRVTIEAGPEVRAAWNDLQAADKKIGELIAQGQLSEVSAQTHIVKISVQNILRGVHVTDESVVKRLVSAGREIVALADRLADVAATGNRARADVVHANLHNYVDFVQKRLPRPEAALSRANPRT